MSREHELGDKCLVAAVVCLDRSGDKWGRCWLSPGIPDPPVPAPLFYALLNLVFSALPSSLLP